MTAQSMEGNNSISLYVVSEANKFKQYDKFNYCIYCKEPQKKIARHLVSSKLHSDEIEIKRIKALPEKSKLRQKLIMRIRNLGNHEHNNLVIRSGAGELVVVSRPTGDTDH